MSFLNEQWRINFQICTSALSEHWDFLIKWDPRGPGPPSCQYTKCGLCVQFSSSCHPLIADNMFYIYCCNNGKETELFFCIGYLLSCQGHVQVLGFFSPSG